MKYHARPRRRSLVEPLESRIFLDVTFDIDTTQDVHPISPYIYGTNYGQAAGFTGYTLARVGGNRWTAYNWTTNASNAGSDWYYNNDNYLGGGSAPGGAVANIIVDTGNHHAPLILTVPTNGLVSADMNGFVDVNDPNRFTTRFVPEYARKGTEFTLTPPTTGPVYQDEFVNWVKQTYPDTQTDPTRPVWYSLDNEPDLWASTHKEVHPDAPTYAEIIQKTIDYAAAIKDVSDISLVFGPVNYGWWGMMTLQNAPDASVAGSLNFQQYYLQQIHNAEVQAGRKLVDVDDVHYYSENYDTNNHRVTDGYTDDAAVAARVQSARSLYDPNYVENSWITQYSTLGPLDFLHRMQNDIDTYNPGTKLAITEYNFGAGNHISGGIAQADALGAFGKCGVFAATYWELWGGTSYVVSAYNMFRNFDGAGATFGDTSTFATTSSMDDSGIFASVDSSDPNKIILVALNRTASTLTGHFSLTDAGVLSSGHWYALTGSGSAIQDLGTVTFNGENTFDVDLPAYSVNTITLTIAARQPVATPLFTPAPGTSSSIQNVVITTTTPNATIRYTLDGSDPSATNGIIYTDPIALSADTQLRAIAYAPGLPDSDIAVGAYVISGPTDITLSATSIAENMPIDTTIGTLGATVSYPDDTCTYSLVSGTGSDDNALFTIQGDQLETAASFDYEARTSYSIRIRATNSGGLHFDKAFTISITNANEAPSAADLHKSLDQDTTLTFSTADFTGTFADPDAGDVLVSVCVTSLPTSGSLTLSGISVSLNQLISAAELGNLAYQPNHNFVGSDTFTYTVSDGSLSSSSATVNLLALQTFNFATLTNGHLIVTGTDAADTILLGVSGDRLTATLNDDTMSFTLADVTDISVNALAGDDSVTVDASVGSKPSTLIGGAGKDTLNGGAGDDSILGQTGADVLSGGAGNDTINGGQGPDSLSGGPGIDLLIGGGGKDTLIGDAGEDVLVRGPNAKRLLPAHGKHAI